MLVDGISIITTTLQWHGKSTARSDRISLGDSLMSDSSGWKSTKQQQQKNKNKIKKGLRLSFSRVHQPIVVLLVPSISTVRSIPAVPEYLFKSTSHHRQKLRLDCTR